MREKYYVKYRTITVLFLLVSALSLGLIFAGQATIMFSIIVGIVLLYFFIITQLVRTTNQETVLCDGRFYVFTAILAYSVIPPIYGILSLEEYQGVRMRTTYTALTYTSEELTKTLFMSLLFFGGLLFGLLLRKHIKQCTEYVEHSYEDDDRQNKKMLLCWLIVCVVSTIGFLLPFIQGGFRIILAGGTISDVDTTHGSSLGWKIIDVFFSSEMMIASTVAVLYYCYQANIGKNAKRTLMVAVVIIEVLLAYFTTRRARALAIIMCALIIYIRWFVNEKGRLPIGRIVTIGAVFVFLYLLEVIMGQTTVGVTYASYLRLFDGVPAYDSLLRSTREAVSPTMLSNMIYGIFRPIPILGKYFIRILGFKKDVSPMYQWMADRYVTYQYGGGLAYTPQLEAYLCLGMVGCFLFGTIYGFVFGKKRSPLPNLFIAAMAFSIARGNTEIVLRQMWPFGIIGYYLYDSFLFRKIKIH